jgi:dTDP-4-amino-4,6-dideoxygalactose transaminase
MKNGYEMSNKPIPFIKPHFPDPKLIANDYESIVKSNWFTNFGPYENKLCKGVANFIGEGVSVTTVANATLGIEIAVKLLFTKDDLRNQVIVPSFTFIAGPAVVISQGFTPVFIDINNSLQPDITQAKQYIQMNVGKISGILLCNTFGVGNTQVDKWEALAKEFGLALIIDSAAGFGSMYDTNTYVGSRGDCEIFSMHATKPFSVGEGGLVVSKNENFISKVRRFENFGFDSNRIALDIGTNAKLQELNCAIGIRQLEDLIPRLENRRNSLEQYKKLLEPKGFEFQENDKLSTVAFVSTLAPNDEVAAEVYSSLVSAGIGVKKYYEPIHRQY